MTALRDEQGELRGFGKVTRDITERKQAQENALRAAQAEAARQAAMQYAQVIEGQREQLRVTLASIGDGVIATDSQRLVTLLNPVAQNLTGWNEADAVGRPLDEVFCIVNEHTQQPVESPVTRVLREGTVVGLANHTVLCARDGKRRPIDDSAAPIMADSGTIGGVVLVFRDATERRAAEAELHKAAERRRLLWEAASVLLSTDEPVAMLRELFARIGPYFSLDSYFNYVLNDAGDALRLVSSLGISQEAAESIARLEFGQAICGAVALHRRPIVATFIQESDEPHVQLAKSLGLRACLCNPLEIGTELVGTLAFASRSRDRFDEDELEFLRIITHYVAVAYERLRLINQLREAARRKDEFLAILAHELRNPLAPIRNAIQILRRASRDPKLSEQATDMMTRQVDQMVRLINDLMDISRISRGKVELRKERVDVASVVSSALEVARPLIDAEGHRLTLNLPPEPIYLDADPTRLAQVIANLVNNAAKYSQTPGKIWLTAERHGREAIISVRDEGIGIPAEHLRHIFEMFSQVAPALQRSHGGLGIGLALARGLVELHRGKVEAKSAGLGKGSEFIVRLPLADAPAKDEGAESPEFAAISSSRKCSVLVVDDNPDAADSLATILSLMGHDVRIAYDGVEAVQTAEGFRPAVVLLDIGMPRMNGYDAARLIRQQPWGKGIALVALTGWGQEEDKRRAFEAGFDEHLTKPVASTELEELLAVMTPLVGQSVAPSG
jgi:PAS domain S-box-containing protein